MIAPRLGDYHAARKLIGCEYPEACDWVGVVAIVTLTGSAATDRVWRACRSHAAQFHNDPEYRVRDSGENNRRLGEGH